MPRISMDGAVIISGGAAEYFRRPGISNMFVRPLD